MGLIPMSGEFAQRIAYNGGNAEYIGECVAVNQNRHHTACWRIKKLVYSGNDVAAVLWADGSNAFNKVWSKRATYTYGA